MFEREKLAPGIGLGKNPDDKEFRLISYQLIDDKCPQLEGNLCRIYAKRPASCRQFPFSYEIDSKTGLTLLGIDLNCPAIERIIENTSRIFFNERKSADKILEIKRIVANKANVVWLYDLKEMTWIIMDNKDRDYRD